MSFSSGVSPPPSNIAILPGSSNSLNHVASHPIPECFHLAMEGESVSPMIVPCHEHPGMNRRTVFGMKLSTGRSQKVTDPFNYEHKYPEDDPYKEMAEDSRFWKTCVDEAAKVDASKVADWTDALDVLLVFAGLFSGVVSTFVCQTFQNLEVDPTELIYIVMLELLDVQRAIDEHGAGSSKQVPRSDTSFRASRTAIWVNTLWFVSLALSLTTALIAVVTKQWIHQYMDSTQIGTPRACARLRQFRFMQLQAWHVPAIIGLLPVLMHVALGVFFAGLITHIRSLNTPAAAVVGLIVFFALLAYVGTNLLPVFNPACPYKTPLSVYAFTALRRIRQFCLLAIPKAYISVTGRIASVLPRLPTRVTESSFAMHAVCSPPHRHGKPVPSGAVVAPSQKIDMPLSLMHAEEQIVSGISDSLDAHTAAWAYTVSSNPSVRNIVVEAISNLPLHVVEIVKSRIGAESLEDALRNAVGSVEYSQLDTQKALERVLRSLFRLFPDTSVPQFDHLPEHSRSGSSLSVLLDISNYRQAATFLAEQILQPSRLYDAPIWAQILRNTFIGGFDWLEAGRKDSEIWQTVVGLFNQSHTCPVCMQTPASDRKLYSLPWYRGLSLNVVDNPQSCASPDHPMDFCTAMSDFMQLSMCDLLLEISYRYFLKEFKTVPSDIRLRLALLQADWMLESSCTFGTSPVGCLIEHIGNSVGIGIADDAQIHHEGVLGATFHGMKKVVFDMLDKDTLYWRDRQQLLHPFFRSIAADQTLIPEYQNWITDDAADRIIELVFMDPTELREVFPLIADILEVAVRAECPKLLPKLCLHLCEVEWLKVMAASLFTWSDVRPLPLRQRSYCLMAAAFVDALHVLKRILDSAYGATLAYTERPDNLLTLCQILLLSDLERRGSLWSLVPLISAGMWTPCLSGLSTFIGDEEANVPYHDLSALPFHPYQDGKKLTYAPMDNLPIFLSCFMTHVQMHNHTCKCYLQTVDSAPPSSCKSTATRLVRFMKKDASSIV